MDCPKGHKGVQGVAGVAGVADTEHDKKWREAIRAAGISVREIEADDAHRYELWLETLHRCELGLEKPHDN